MNKVVITMVSIIIVMVAAICGYLIFKNVDVANNNNQVKIAEGNVNDNDVEDECTDEWNDLEENSKQQLVQANSSEEKISPNCSFTLKKYYKTNNHLITDQELLPKDIVNKTKEQLQELYPDWEIEKFSSNDVVLYKEFDGECDEDFVLREKDGYIVIFQKTDKGEEEYMETTIPTEYLTKVDKSSIQNGLEVFGKEDLNKILEDFE